VTPFENAAKHLVIPKGFSPEESAFFAERGTSLAINAKPPAESFYANLHPISRYNEDFQ
jgi:hypothetical protein